MPTSPRSPSSSLSQNPLTIRLYKVLAANFDDDATKEALETLAELYAPTPSPASAKSKGKERASAEDLDDWDVERRDLPEQFLSSGSVDLARRLVFENAVRTTPLQSRLKELEHTVSYYLALFQFNPSRRYDLLGDVGPRYPTNGIVDGAPY